jgi:hypothetical protein
MSPQKNKMRRPQDGGQCLFKLYCYPQVLYIYARCPFGMSPSPADSFLYPGRRRHPGGRPRREYTPFLICTHPSRFLSHPRYVTSLEDRLEQLEEILKQVCPLRQPATDAQVHQVRPDTDFTVDLGPSIPRGSWKEEEGASVASTSRLRVKNSPPESSLRLSTRLALNSHPRRHDGNDTDSSLDGFSTSDSEQMVEGLRGGPRKLTLGHARSSNDKEDRDAVNTRFHGKSSAMSLVGITRRYKELHISDAVWGDTEQEPASIPKAVPESHTSFKRPEFWLPQPVGPPLHF